jgi:hypothetical protein
MPEAAAARSLAGNWQLTAGATGVLTFMAECFWPDMSEAKVQAAGTRAGHAARAASRDGDAVRYLGAILIPADEVAFCLFEASSAQLVQKISERAQIPFERILETVRLDVITMAAPSDGDSEAQPTGHDPPPPRVNGDRNL